jgi:hypothetical protein
MSVGTALIFVGAAVGGAQSPATDFELAVTAVTTGARGGVTVRCVRGCRLLVATSTAGGETRWTVFPRFVLDNCGPSECSSGQVLGGVVSQSPSPDFDLWVATSVEGSVIKCVRGCKFAAVVGAPRAEDPPAKRVPEVRFPCNGESCASGIVGGWVER